MRAIAGRNSPAAGEIVPDCLILSRELLGRLILHCQSEYPKEACGLLVGTGNIAEKIYNMTNIEQSHVSYMMDPAEQFSAMKEMRRDGTEMVAIYHSHPHSTAYPSARDVSLAFYPDALYLIVGLAEKHCPEVRVFIIREGVVQEVSIVYPVDAPLKNKLK